MSEPANKIETPAPPPGSFHPHSYREVAFTGYRELPPLLYKIRVSLAQGPKAPSDEMGSGEAKKKILTYLAIGLALYFAMTFLFPSDPPPTEPDHTAAETATPE